MATKETVKKEPAKKVPPVPPAAAATMTAKEFNALKPRLARMTEKTVQLARDVLVSGQGLAEAGEKVGLTRQRVKMLVDRVLAVRDEIPADWKKIDIFLPREEAAKVRAIEARAKEKLSAKRKH
jgi:hypothetical protein